MEEYQYQDPVTAFLTELYVEFDFEAAQRELSKAEQVVANDFFLGEFRDEFMDNARYLISEAYCRIHQRIDIGDLSERLNLSRDEGEKWIVNLIRETRMGADAKIDLEKNVIEINRPPLPSIKLLLKRHVDWRSEHKHLAQPCRGRNRRRWHAGGWSSIGC
ncbi:eukaryotic translation initiation factor 3 subunit E [Taiwanofungus camphoratus]|nr:eukaryotic translation initiation factor 3 subunit E [Antrodia cinnamomea]